MRNSEKIKIKEAILKTLELLGLGAAKIILFGSRARGDFSKYSDYDILIITKKKLSRTSHHVFNLNIQR